MGLSWKQISIFCLVLFSYTARGGYTNPPPPPPPPSSCPCAVDILSASNIEIQIINQAFFTNSQVLQVIQNNIGSVFSLLQSVNQTDIRIANLVQNIQVALGGNFTSIYSLLQTVNVSNTQVVNAIANFQQTLSTNITTLQQLAIYNQQNTANNFTSIQNFLFQFAGNISTLTQTLAKNCSSAKNTTADLVLPSRSGSDREMEYDLATMVISAITLAVVLVGIIYMCCCFRERGAVSTKSPQERRQAALAAVVADKGPQQQQLPRQRQRTDQSEGYNDDEYY